MLLIDFCTFFFLPVLFYSRTRVESVLWFFAQSLFFNQESDMRRPHGSARAASLGNSGFSGWRGSQRPLICKGGDEPPSSCDYLLPNHSASTLDRLQWWPFTAWTFHSADPQKNRCKKARFSLPLCGISSNRLRNGCCCRSSRHVSEATRVGCTTRQFCQRG